MARLPNIHVRNRLNPNKKPRKWRRFGHYINMEKSALLQSHDELRAVLRLAGAELKKKSIGRKDSPLLQLMRRVLREARTVANAERAETSKAKKAGAGKG